MNLSEYVRKALVELVRIPSTPDDDVNPILDSATATIQELGLKPQRHPEVGAVTASSGMGGLLLNGHLNTVPMASGWTRDQGTWEGEFLYGRGTADMKAGCVAGRTKVLSETTLGSFISTLGLCTALSYCATMFTRSRKTALMASCHDHSDRG